MLLKAGHLAHFGASTWILFLNILHAGSDFGLHSDRASRKGIIFWFTCNPLCDECSFNIHQTNGHDINPS
jgi:hypothetical protein